LFVEIINGFTRQIIAWLNNFQFKKPSLMEVDENSYKKETEIKMPLPFKP
jgi:hypothetical protein